jgi:hypothetical protein
MDSDPGGVMEPPSRPLPHKRRRIVVLGVVLGPLVVLIVLTLLIIRAMKTGPYMNEPPKGAGAGHTGMYNEYMKSK